MTIPFCLSSDGGDQNICKVFGDNGLSVIARGGADGTAGITELKNKCLANTSKFVKLNIFLMCNILYSWGENNYFEILALIALTL